MPKRVESDEEDDSKSKKRRSTEKKKSTSSKTSTVTKRTRNSKAKSDSVISAWAKRQSFNDAEGIEDVEITPPKRAEPRFEVEDGEESLECRLIKTPTMFPLLRNWRFTKGRSRKFRIG